MALLYKFTGMFRPPCDATSCQSERAGALSIIESLKLRIPTPKCFNDPFEVTPRSYFSAEGFAEHLRSQKERFAPTFPDFAERTGYPHSFDYFVANDLASHIKSRLPDLEHNWCHDLVQQDMESINKASEQVGILCLAQNLNSICMWSYYANSHRGIALGFDFDLNPPQVRCHEGWVDYSDERYAIDFWQDLDMDKWQDLFRKNFFRKSNVWSHEKEYRYVIPLEDLSKDRRGDYFLHFNPENLREVIFGASTPSHLVSEVQALLGSRPQTFGHVRQSRCERHPTLFDLQITTMT